jgi:hypothetical protein
MRRGISINRGYEEDIDVVFTLTLLGIWIGSLLMFL